MKSEKVISLVKTRLAWLEGRISLVTLNAFLKLIYYLKIGQTLGTPHLIAKKSHVIVVHPHSDILETPVVFMFLKTCLKDNFRFLVANWLIEVNKFLSKTTFYQLIPRGAHKWFWFEEAKKILQSNLCVGMYLTGDLQNGHSYKIELGKGAARLALTTNKPILPIYVHSNLKSGLAGFLKAILNPWHKVDIVVGKGFYLPIFDLETESLMRASQYIENKILSLKKQLK